MRKKLQWCSTHACCVTDDKVTFFGTCYQINEASFPLIGLQRHGGHENPDMYHEIPLHPDPASTFFTHYLKKF
jgi:hypothetical protein